MNQQTAFSDPTIERQRFIRRMNFAGICVITLMFALLARYADLQVNQYKDFVTYSEKNRVHVRSNAPARGVIYDRRGEILADNRSSSNLSIIKERTDDLEGLIIQIAELIELSKADIKRFYKRLSRSRPFEQTPLKFNLTEEEQAILAVNEYLLEGVKVSARLKRYYPKQELFAHVVGYVGRINDREINAIDPIRYSGTDSIGKIGIEKFYESQLLGEVGNEHVESNARGRVMRILEKNEPTPGQNLILHLDSHLQRIAHEAFGNERGSLVAIDINTGGILAMVSAPSYDPNEFVNGISQKDYDALLQSPGKPMFNRSIRGQYPPASTVKPLFGLIGLEREIISSSTAIEDPGYFIMEGIERPWRDHNSKRGGHGKGVDLAKAIVESCDVFFYHMGVKLGIDVMANDSKFFGLGSPTGIDVHGEASGIMPSRDWKKNSRGASWFNGDTINMSIGQGFMLVTPLQLAVMTARIAAKGRQVQPKLVKSINGIEQPPILMPETYLADEKHWEYIHNAMRDVVHSPKGTARAIGRDTEYLIAGKTGTAQVVSINADEDYDKSKLDKSQWDHALFVGFAPFEDPTVALGVIVENGEHGSSSAAPIAKRVIDAYMSSYHGSPSKMTTKSKTQYTANTFIVAGHAEH
jgi:penicillin-binding protein 2